MLVWNAMPSMTALISPMRRLATLMRCMVWLTASISSPPWAAAVLASIARALASRAASALLRTVPASCSIEAAVCCRFAACSSVRCERSVVPVAIWVEPVAMLSLASRTRPTTLTRLPSIWSSARTSRPGSPPSSLRTRCPRSPLATRSAT